MKKEYLDKVNKQFNEIMSDMVDWEVRHEDSVIWKFYNDILYFHFYKEPDGADDCGYQSCVGTDLYRFLKDATGCSGDDSLDFITGLQSFLSNCCLDDSYFKIKWQKTWINPDDKYDHDLNRYEDCDRHDQRACPSAHWAHDEEEGHSQDIKLLEEALAILIEKNKKYVAVFERLRARKNEA